MKRIEYFFIILLTLSITLGCVKDLGNYDYNEVVIAEIEPIELPSVIEQLSEVEFEPNILFSDPQMSFDDFDYVWYLYQTDGTNMAAAPSTIDTLSTERNLKAVITSVPGSYRLNFKVIDKASKTYSRVSTMVQIVRGESVGYAILSDINGEAELAFVTTSGTVQRNVFEGVNGRKAGTNPTGLHFPRGNMNRFKALWILCNDINGGSITSDMDYSEYHTVREMCVFPPATEFKNLKIHNEGFAPFEVLINDGVLYNRSINSTYPLIPFGAPTPADFKVESFLFTNITGTGIFYDNTNMRFRKVGTLQYMDIVEWTDFADGLSFDPKNVGLEMLQGYMCGSLQPFTLKTLGRAVMRGAGGSTYLMNFNADFSGGITPGVMHDISSHEGANSTEIYTIKGEGDYAYYSYDGNKIGVSSFITGASLYQYDDLIPSNLTIDFMKAERFVGLNELWIAASDGSGTADSGTFFIFSISSDGTLRLKAQYSGSCGKVVDIVYKD